MNIYALMVIYNKSVTESPVYNFLKAAEVQMVVCDNSTEENDNKHLVETDGGWYVKIPDNGGLAKAYNAGIKCLFAEGAQENDYVCLFDDDSIVDNDYFEVLNDAIFRDANDLFLPVVEDDNGIMSPAVLPHLYCRRVKDTAELMKTPRRKLTGINSGMAVKLSIYKEFSYDERYFMDYIDHDFIMTMRDHKIYPKMMDTHIKQNFSAVTDDAQNALSRFARQREDLRVFYEDRSLGGFAYLYVVVKKRIKLLLKYRKFEMLFR